MPGNVVVPLFICAVGNLVSTALGRPPLTAIPTHPRSFLNDPMAKTLLHLQGIGVFNW